MKILQLVSLLLISTIAASAEQPLRVGVVGLVHTHVHWILGREDIGDIKIVGIVEPNRDLAERYSEMHGFPMDIVYDNLEEMISAVKPEAVTAFNTIYGHLEVVEYCAPRGIHVMVEKPLAVSIEHAEKMAALARKHEIHLLTNYETSWYGSNYKAYDLLYNKQLIGEPVRIVFNTGHPGPIEIGCNEEFLEWLTDPVLNGGGALTDFGCYGSNLATWILKGIEPEAVTCVTRSLKPEKYPEVEDDATIILSYPDAEVLIQASWNWSHNRKDMTIYGQTGYIECVNGSDMVILEDEKDGPYDITADGREGDWQDPFAYLNAVVKGRLIPSPTDVSSLDNNLTVMRILHAAKESSRQGKTVNWSDLYGH